jgi:hypothetical protein
MSPGLFFLRLATLSVFCKNRKSFAHLLEDIGKILTCTLQNNIINLGKGLP